MSRSHRLDAPPPANPIPYFALTGLVELDGEVRPYKRRLDSARGVA
jgi:hypothetical protein